jgi:hypothetical protein
MKLVTGCGRSGTKYAALYFGLGHEYMSDAGIASWYLAPAKPVLPPWHGQVPDEDWDEVIHIVRHPLDCISSLSTLASGSWSWMQDYIDIGPDMPPLVKAMQYWLQWNDMAEARVEMAPAGIKALHIESLWSRTLRTDINTRNHDMVDWGDLLGADEDLYRQVMQRAFLYGYRIDKCQH